MAWYDEAVFYHIYPLGLTGAPKENPYGEPVHRLRTLFPWIEHIRSLGCSALYIGRSLNPWAMATRPPTIRSWTAAWGQTGI